MKKKYCLLSIAIYCFYGASDLLSTNINNSKPLNSKLGTIKSDEIGDLTTDINNMNDDKELQEYIKLSCKDDCRTHNKTCCEVVKKEDVFSGSLGGLIDNCFRELNDYIEKEAANKKAKEAANKKAKEAAKKIKISTKLINSGYKAFSVGNKLTCLGLGVGLLLTPFEGVKDIKLYALASLEIGLFSYATGICAVTGGSFVRCVELLGKGINSVFSLIEIKLEEKVGPLGG